MPREPLETPNEDNAMRTMPSRRSPTHGPSLRRFGLEERAPFTREGTFASNASLRALRPGTNAIAFYSSGATALKRG
jgi:hypothetical protein